MAGLFGQGAAGLVASAREQYGLILDLATAKEWIKAFQETYPDFTRWCRAFARSVAFAGAIAAPEVAVYRLQNQR